jgi:hypothetical protein
MSNASVQRTAPDESQGWRHTASHPHPQHPEDLWARDAPRLFSLARRLTGGAWAEAEDIVQETFMEAARQWELASRLEHTYGWLRAPTMGDGSENLGKAEGEPEAESE